MLDMDMMNYLFIAIYILLAFFLFICVPMHIIRRVRTGKKKQPITYSFKSVFIVSFQAFLAVIIVTLLTYYFSKSYEVTISIGVFFTVCVIAGLLKSL